MKEYKVKKTYESVKRELDLKDKIREELADLAETENMDWEKAEPLIEQFSDMRIQKGLRNWYWKMIFIYQKRCSGCGKYTIRKEQYSHYCEETEKECEQLEKDRHDRRAKMLKDLEV